MRLAVKGLNFGAAIAALLLGAWWTFPAWAPLAVKALWPGPSSAPSLQLTRPGWRGLLIRQASWKSEHIDVSLERAHFRWWPDISLDAESLRVTLSKGPDRSESRQPSVPKGLAGPWPVTRVRHLVVATPVAIFDGSWRSSARAARLTGHVRAESDAWPLDARLSLDRSATRLTGSLAAGNDSRLFGAWPLVPGAAASLQGRLGRDLLGLMPHNMPRLNRLDIRLVANLGTDPLSPDSWRSMHGDWLATPDSRTDRGDAMATAALSGTFHWRPEKLVLTVAPQGTFWIPLPAIDNQPTRLGVGAPLLLSFSPDQNLWELNAGDALEARLGERQFVHSTSVHLSCREIARCRASGQLHANLDLGKLPSASPASGNLVAESGFKAFLNDNHWSLELVGSTLRSPRLQFQGSPLTVSAAVVDLESIALSGQTDKPGFLLSPVKGRAQGAWSWEALQGTWSTSLTHDARRTDALGTLMMGSETLDWRVSLHSKNRLFLQARGKDLTLPRWLGALGGKRWRLFSGQADIKWQAHLPLTKLKAMDSAASLWTQVSRHSETGSQVRLRHLGGHFEKVVWEDVQLALTLKDGPSWDVTGELGMLNTAADIALQDAKWHGTIDPNARLSLKTASGKVLGGDLSLSSLTLPLLKPFDSWQIRGDLKIRHLSLKALTDALAMQGLSADGAVDMILPFTLEQGRFGIQQGTLHATSPGVLKYQRGLRDQNLAFAALENFHFSELDGQLDYAPAGDYRLKMRLVGTNPDMPDYAGVPFAINPDIKGHLPRLFWSVFVTGDFEKNLYDRLRQQKP
jgi:hypothetical protein